MSRIVSLPTKKQQADARREFLTRPSSWIRLGFFLLLVVGLIWVIGRPRPNQLAGSKQNIAAVTKEQLPADNGQDTSTYGGAESDDKGTVAGVTDTKISAPKEKTQEEKDQEKLVADMAATQKAAEALLGQADDIKQLFLSGQDYLNQGKLPEAEIIFKRATHIAPEYRDAWYLLGYTYLKEFEQGPKAKSIDSLNKAQWAVITLTKAAALDPLSDTVKNLLDIAKKVTGK